MIRILGHLQPNRFDPDFNNKPKEIIPAILLPYNCNLEKAGNMVKSEVIYKAHCISCNEVNLGN